MKKKIAWILAAAMLALTFVGCSSNQAADNSGSQSGSGTSQSGTNTSGASAGLGDTEISVISREDGSGTRGAFIELFGVEQKDADGNKVDCTIDTAEITNSTAVMLTTVAGNKAAIGYVSLGSLDTSVKALKIDGVDATTDNIKNGSYGVSRPFNIVTGGTVSDTAQDFINYIMSDEGQAIVEEKGYISQGSTGAYEDNAVAGSITVAGSSSVSPVMEKLAEAYMSLHGDVKIELQTSDSTTGVTNAADGLCDIGMASRELKESEAALGLSSTTIAIDGIAVIVNLENPVADMSKDQVCGIYTGTIVKWSEVN